MTAVGDLLHDASAGRERDPEPRDRNSAVTMVTIYLVLLLAVPSNARIAALGSLGRPSLLWGLVLFAGWVLWRLTDAHRSPSRTPAGAVAYFAPLAIALVNLAAALLRGQPPDQVSPAITSILRMLSWGGVLLVVWTAAPRTEVITLCRRIAIGSGALAVLGLVHSSPGRACWTGSAASRVSNSRRVGSRSAKRSFAPPERRSIHSSMPRRSRRVCRSP